MDTAIQRVSSHEKVTVNASPVYATYTSGSFNGFYATEAEAIAHCDNPENGVEFNGQWFQDRYSAFEAGQLFQSDESVFISEDKSRFLDPIAGSAAMPFVQWVEYVAGKPAVSVA